MARGWCSWREQSLAGAGVGAATGHGVCPSPSGLFVLFVYVYHLWNVNIKSEKDWKFKSHQNSF